MRGNILHFALFGLATLAASPVCRCAPDPCGVIFKANKATTFAQNGYTTSGKPTGVKIAPFMSKIHMHQTGKTCKFVRDDSLNGEAVSIYTQHLVAPEGSTDEEIWISKKSDRILREEIEGNITGQGKGHLSMLFHYK